MRVLLINPPFQRLKKVQAPIFPIGLGYLAAALIQDGFECKIYNAELAPDEENCVRYINNVELIERHDAYMRSLHDPDHPVWKEISETLQRYKPDLVGITVMTAKFGSAMRVSQLCKSHNETCWVIWGGPHPAIQPDEVMAHNEVDFLARGEGDETIVELCRCLKAHRHKDLDKVKGLSHRRGEKVIHNPARPLVKDLDALPLPARNALMYADRCPAGFLAMMVTLRGCVFKCAYCCAPQYWQKRVRYRSVENVVEELKEITGTYGVFEVSFWDDNFTLNRRRTIQLCQKMLEEHLNITWECSTRVDLLDEELLCIMRKAGCRCIDVGIETGSPRMLQKVDKGISLEQIQKAIRVMEKTGMAWRAFFMIGFPEETPNDIEQTLALMRRIRPLKIWLSIFTPYPGTKLYNVSRRLGLIPEKPDWSKYSHQSPESYFLKNLQRDEFNEYVKKMAKYVDAYNNDLKFLMKRLSYKNSYWPTLFSKQRIKDFLSRTLSG